MRLLLISIIAWNVVFADEHSQHYTDGEDVVIWFNTVGPVANIQETYEFTQLPFCLGEKDVTHHHESIGEALIGIELIHSGIDIHFKETQVNAMLCKKTLEKRDVHLFRYAILNSYQYSLYVDNLLAKDWVGSIDAEDTTSSPKLSVFSHRTFKFEYNNDQIISVSVKSSKPVQLDPAADKNLEIDFTYTVEWIPTEMQFSDRFSKYLDSNFFEHKIHWFSIANSFMMVIFLVCVVSVILLRTLRRDFARYEREEGLLDIDRDLGEEAGWKLVHGDVFRAPPHLTLFAALNGTGLQLIALTFVVILATIAGSLYKERATVLTASIFTYALSSTISGYYSGSLYTRNGGKNWVRAMIAVALFWPGIVCLTAFVINFVAIYYQTSRAIPFTTMLSISAIWLFLVFPLTLLGTIVGRNWSSNPHFPCRINPIPRPIPDKTIYAEPSFIIMMGGLLPFGAIFIELYFIFTSFWEYRVYYVYGFMLLVFLILLSVTACVSIVATYFLLNSEDHRWHWTIFFASGSTSAYIFLYSIYYFKAVTRMYGIFQTVWYFGYTSLACFTIFCMLGSVGYVTAELFVRSIYQNVKID